ncbi:MAG: Cof-type HAD-IIB family hydrolase [Actinomycetota bacterium]
MRPRLVVSDLDGTLLGTAGQLSPTTIDVLQRLRADGVTVVAATGRAPRSAMARLRDLGVVDALVCSNGSIVHDPADDETVRRHPIDSQHLLDAFRSLDAAFDGVACCWELDDRYGWDAGFDHIGTTHEDTTGFGVADRPTEVDVVTKLMVAHPELRRLELRDAMREVLEVPVTLGCSGVEFVEITGHLVDKASTVAAFAVELGIDREDVIAFGDNANDLELLAWAGVGVAVENALPETKEVADRVIGHHADDAVARHLRELYT